MEGVEEINAELRGLGFELEETGAGQGPVVTRLIGREAHDATATAGEDAEIGADEAREFVHERGDAGGVGLVEAMGGTVKSEDGGLLKFAGHFLADEESVLFSVDVLVEILGELVIPVNLEAELIEHIETRVGVAREEITVSAGGFAKDDPL